MSIGITHFAVGGMLSYLVWRTVSRERRLDALVIVLGGLWAMLPDVNKVAQQPTADALHRSVLANVFWGHQLLDTADPDDELTVGVIALVFLLHIVVVGTVSQFGGSQRE